MDNNLDQKSKYNLIGYLKSKVEGECNSKLIQDASKSRNGYVDPMIDILLYTSLTCSQADAVMLKIKNNDHMSKEIRIELLEVVKESNPNCKFGAWDAND